MAPIIVERARLGVGIGLLLLATGLALAPPATTPRPTRAALAPPPLPGPPPTVADLSRDLASPGEERALMAVYQACALPPAQALAVATEAAATENRQAQALARVVRDCGLPAAQAVAELEALLHRDPQDPLAAVAVLELHRLGATDSPALVQQATQHTSLSAWIAAYSVDSR